jgi:hypothetical protein
LTDHILRGLTVLRALLECFVCALFPDGNESG